MSSKKNIKIEQDDGALTPDKIIEDSFAESISAAAADAEYIAAPSPEPRDVSQSPAPSPDRPPMPRIEVVNDGGESASAKAAPAVKTVSGDMNSDAAAPDAPAKAVKTAPKAKTAAVKTASKTKTVPEAEAENDKTEDKKKERKKITPASETYKPKDISLATPAERMKDKAAKEADPRSIAAKQGKLKEAPVGKKKVNETNSGLKLLYQPVFEPAKELLIGFECLLRIYDVELGVLTPGMFLEVAQKDAKLIKRLEIWSVEEVLRSSKKLKDQNLQILSVNISTKHFFDSDFIETISRIIERAETRPQNIFFEFREEVLFGPYVEVVNKFAALQALGIKIAIDDFGTNYFAGEKKPDFKLDMVKLPFGLVKQFLNDRKAKSVIRIIIAYAKQKKFDVVALGVETKAQEETLLKMGVRKMQGYLYSKPLTTQRVSIKKK